MIQRRDVGSVPRKMSLNSQNDKPIFYLISDNNELESERYEPIVAMLDGLEEFIKSEDTDYSIVQLSSEEELPALNDSDIALSFDIVDFKQGGKSIDWLILILLYLTLIGPLILFLFFDNPSSIEIKVTYKFSDGTSIQKIYLSKINLQWWRIFGGSSEKLMKENGKILGYVVAEELVRKVIGHSKLNSEVIADFYGAIALGLFGLLVPFLAIWGLVSTVKYMNILANRNCKRGKFRALTALSINIVALLVQIVCLIIFSQMVWEANRY